MKYDNSIDIWAIGCIQGEITDGQPLFAGDSEIDQLYIIQKDLGALTPSQMEMFFRNPRFQGLKFPDFGRPETLKKSPVVGMSYRHPDDRRVSWRSGTWARCRSRH